MKRHHFVDLHIHSNFSDGQLSISEIVDLYGSKGFSAIALTDHLADSKTLTGQLTQHLKLSLTEKTMDLYLSTLKKEAERALQKYNMHVIPGVEVTLNSWSRSKGAHLVFLNVDQYINPNQEIEELLIQNKKYFSIAAHPIWEKSFEFKTTYLWDHRDRLKKYFDAWECATANQFSKEVYLSNLPRVFSSDFHSPKKSEGWRSSVFCEDLDIPNLFKMIKNREIEPAWMSFNSI